MMLRVLILIAVALLLLWIGRRVLQAIVALRTGAVPPGMDIVEVKLERDRGWQVTRVVRRGVAVVRVEHPDEGVAREWTIQLRDPGAATALDEAMQRAGMVVRHMVLGRGGEGAADDEHRSKDDSSDPRDDPRGQHEDEDHDHDDASGEAPEEST